MTSHRREAADRVKEHVPITALLRHYGFPVREDGFHEQQFPCDMHGDGRDTKPSARVYPQTNSWYCFACGKARDVIATVQEREDIGFWEAIRILERMAGLPPLSRKEHSEEAHLSPVAVDERDIRRLLQRIEAILRILTEDRRLDATRTAVLWEVYDTLSDRVSRAEFLSEEALHTVRRFFQRVREEATQ